MLSRSSFRRLPERSGASASALVRPSPTLRPRVLALAAIAAIVLLVLGPALGRATASADGAPGLPDLTFYGRGYGHGVGMSQYGARGRALAGQLAPEILAHYYASTTLGTRGPATTVRVLLLTGLAATPARPLTIVGRYTLSVRQCVCFSSAKK